MEKLISKLSSVGWRRRPVFLEDHIFGYMDGIVGTVAFGNIYGTEHFAYKEHFHHVIDEAMVVRSSFSAEDYFPNAIGRLVDRLTGVASLRERVFREFDAFFEMMLEQHLDPTRRPKQPDNNGCGGLIDVLVGLMKEHQQQGSFRFSRDVVKALLTNTFIGAVDTGTVTIIWAMAEMVRKPEVLRKAQEEIRAVAGSKGRVQKADVAKLRYLMAVVMETLRLHPALPLLVPRETMRRITVSGYDMPARTRVFVNAWAIGRDPASWDDPEEFVPERFDGDEAATSFFNRARFEFLPFGAGRRMCPGIDMGVATTEFTLANLLYCFDWELPEGVRREDMSMEEAGGLTVHKKTPLLLVPIRYSP
ncbi:4-hydroxyphenylacetaldehyde oxime monooxygenase-like [Miscanthus floridulus]|uniref:4-hydroxyphenylacetaldehyde oxime monooxygenase-like n=1 Tax=Miscanthus floridulus TaxID=154761 RepID=UPI003457BA32